METMEAVHEPDRRALERWVRRKLKTNDQEIVDEATDYLQRRITEISALREDT